MHAHLPAALRSRFPIASRSLALGTFALIAGLAAVSGARAEPLYSLKEIVFPTGYSGYVLGLNLQGETTGYVAHVGEPGKMMPFTLSHGHLKVLSLPWQQGDGIGWAINDRGDVAGQASVGEHETHAFLWIHGRRYDLGMLPGGDWADARDVNNHREATGQVRGADRVDRAFVYEKGKMKLIEGLTGLSEGSAINDLGEVAGSYGMPAQGRAFVYSKGTVVTLGTLGGRDSYANDINVWGDVVGMADLADGRTHAFLYSNGAMIDLTPLVNYSRAAAINRWSQVVGGMDLGGGHATALLYSGMPYDLAELVVNLGSVRLAGALAINDEGRILCEGRNAAGQVRHYLLTPLDGCRR